MRDLELTGSSRHALKTECKKIAVDSVIEYVSNLLRNRMLIKG